ncbi:MAG: hypothetical protein LPK00_11865 [Bacillaceae bacterium]|nr:hypothetical protein [Bacillaceae bacterium]
MLRDERVTYETTSFWFLLKTVSIKNLFINIRTLLSILFSLSFYYLFTGKDIDTTAQYFGNTIATISASLLGIVIAGLAILIAVLQGRIFGVLLQKKLLQRFLFPFWFITFLWGISTIICLIIAIFYSMISSQVLLVVMSIEIFIFTYSLLGTVNLMGHSIRIGLFLADLES